MAGWFGTADNNVLQPLLRIFEAENPGVTVNVLTGYQIDKMMVALAAGTAPDIFAAHGGWYSDLARQNALMPMNDLMAAIGMSESTLAPGYDKLGEIDGKRWAIPFLDCAPNYALVFNNTLFAEAGLPAFSPNTVPDWQTVGNYHKKLTQVGPDGKVIRLGYNPMENPQLNYYSFECFFDAPVYDQYDRPTINTPEMINAFETTFANFIQPIGAEVYWANRSLAFEKRQVAMHTSGSLLLGNRLATSLPGDEIGASWIPHIKGWKVQRLRGWALTISAQCKYPVEAMRLIAFLTIDPRVLNAIWEERGRFGVGISFLQAKAKSVSPLESWFIQTLFNADRLYVEDMTPMKNTLTELVGEARDAYFSGKMPARTALDNAQQQAMAEWAELQTLVK
ncbi:MAG TPA: extracellular solute-binding protein [Firmicutes bacterium]|nr:extracellular solute-binding protein [Bacillota bacterium]